MSERDMHEQDLEVIHVVKANHEARKQAHEVQDYCEAEYTVFPYEETMEDRVRMIKVKVLPVLAWVGGGIFFLTAMSNGLCGAEMGVAGSLLCFFISAVTANRKWGRRYA